MELIYSHFYYMCYTKNEVDSMKMQEILQDEFHDYIKDSSLNSYYQTDNYAKAMNIYGFEYKFIAYKDMNDTILAAGMFLFRKIINNLYYAYCPRGFIIDYDDPELLRKFTNNIKKYLKKMGVIILKINPDIKIADIDYTSFEKTFNENTKILETLKKYGWKKRKETLPLQLIEPKIKATINLKNYNISSLENDIKEKIEYGINKGLEIEAVGSNGIETFYNFIKDKPLAKPLEFYSNLFNYFETDNLVDLLLVKINYEKYLIGSKKKVEEEQERNNLLNNNLQKYTSDKALMDKMDSDSKLDQYRKDVTYATNELRNNKSNRYIAGALVIKYENTISIISIAFDEEYDNLNAKHFFYDRIFDLYKEDFEIADINEIADISIGEEFESFNKIKLDFKPQVYETIGELDLVVNEWKIRFIKNNNYLINEIKKQ